MAKGGETRDDIDAVMIATPDHWHAPICNVEIGAGTAICCHLLNIAYRSGETVKWDPNKRELISDHKKSIWYPKERRAPFDKLA